MTYLKPWNERIGRTEWFSLTGQVTGFYGYLERTAQDDHSIAEIVETEDGRIVGYLWTTFCKDEESGFCFVEIQEIYIEEEFRRHGMATRLYEYVELKARRSGAKVIRSGTGLCNRASVLMHEKLGFAPYRCEFEKNLTKQNDYIDIAGT